MEDCIIKNKVHSSFWLRETTEAAVKKLAKKTDRKVSEMKRELIEFALEQPVWKDKLIGGKE